MDQGGNFPLLFGVGPDGIGGTADDPDVDFGEDVLQPERGLRGDRGHPHPRRLRRDQLTGSQPQPPGRWVPNTRCTHRPGSQTIAGTVLFLLADIVLLIPRPWSAASQVRARTGPGLDIQAAERVPS